METIVIQPDVDDRLVIQEKGVPRHRALQRVVIAEDRNVYEPPRPEPPHPEPAPADSAEPEYRSYRSHRSVDTRRWMLDATHGLVDAMLCSQMPKETASLWARVADADLGPLIETQRERERRAAGALQASIESSSAERAVELAAERDRCLAAMQDRHDELAAATDRCVDAIDAAVHTSGRLRSDLQRERREVSEVRRSLDRLCTPHGYRRWAPRIREVLAEEADAAYASLDRSCEASRNAMRSRKPVTLPSTPGVGLVTNAHLQTLVDAADRRQQLEALRRLQAVAARSSQYLCSCARCDGPGRACAQCQAEVEAA